MEQNTVSNHPIAIVGVSCRFPGASNLTEFWKVLLNGINVISEIPLSRFNIKDYFDTDTEADGKMNQIHGAYLENIHDFDPLFFNISPKEAMEMHPSQKLMLELAWEAVESSQIPYSAILNSKAGVYFGHIWNDFEHFRKEREAPINNFSAIGQSANIIASRISYFFGLRGPSFVLDTGCSSSMVAVGLGIQSLRNKSIDLCFGGGVNHILNPEQYVYLGKFGGLSALGKCSSFDAEADGFVRAEGAGIIIMKRLEDAIKDNDRIYAVIRGCAMNNNGFNDNLPATSVRGQKELLEEAYRDADLDFYKVHFVETHGTGTKIGDPNEAIALGEIMGKNRKEDNPLFIGSVKTNFGHTEAAAGIAGLIKVILSIQHHVLPKNLHFVIPNPKINFDELKIRVQNQTTPWPVKSSETLKAGINSFGWGGTNVHLVLEEFKKNISSENIQRLNKSVFILPISARSLESLQNYLKVYLNFLNKEEFSDTTRIYDVCKASSLLRPHFEYRALINGRNQQELIGSINEVLQRDIQNIESKKYVDNDGIVFIFPGQGSQWLGMGKDLYENEDVFRKAIDECEKAFSKYTNWSLIKEIYANKEDSGLTKINVIQPFICAVQIALARLWISNGVTPVSIVGHSMGEVAAAHIAGILSLDDAARIICIRSRLMGKLSGTDGAMALTELSLEEAKNTTEKYQGKICVAVHNSPKSTVLAGDIKTIQRVISELEGRNLFCRKVNVDVASHSPQMDAIKEDLRIELMDIKPQKAIYTFHSTVRVKQMEGPEMNADYWVDNLRNTVQFASVIDELADRRHSVYIEISPHPVLLSSINECLVNKNSEVGVFSSTHREKPERYEFFSNLQNLYRFGIRFDWERVYGSFPLNHINLPGYPFERKVYELEKKTESIKQASDTHPLIGKSMKLADTDNFFYWNNVINLNSLSFIAGHVVNETSVLPASAYIEMILASSTEIYGIQPFELKNIEFRKAISIDKDSAISIQLKIESVSPKFSKFFIFFKTSESQTWETSCLGNIVSVRSIPDIVPDIPKSINLQTSCLPDFYRSFRKIGVNYSPVFQNVKINSVEQQRIIATVAPDPKIIRQGRKYHFNPVLLDNLIQPVFSCYFKQDTTLTQKFAFVSSIERISINPKMLNFTDGILLADIVSSEPISDSTENRITFSANLKAFYKDQFLIQMEGISAKIVDLGVPFNDKVVNESGNWYTEWSNADEPGKIKIVQTGIIKKLAKLIKAQESTINTSMTFKGLGVDSIMAVQLRNNLEKEFNIKFAVVDMWKTPVIKDFSKFINVLLSKNMDQDNVKPELEQPKEIVTLTARPDAKICLICFHDAGGSMALFDGWDNLLGPEIEVSCIQLPGRGDRLNEEPYRSYKQFITDYMPLIHDKLKHRPFMLYGHSMGGLLAFETARNLQYNYGLKAEILILSGTPSLNGYVNNFINQIIESKWTDEQLANLLPSAVNIDLKNEFHAKLIQTLRADFELIYSYKYIDGPKLLSGVIAFIADTDDRVPPGDVLKWKNETQGKFYTELRKGGHDFIYFDQEYVTTVIKQHLTGIGEKGNNKTPSKKTSSKKYTE